MSGREKKRERQPTTQAPADKQGSTLGAWLVDKARAEGFDDAGVVRIEGPPKDAPALQAAVASGRLLPFDWMARTLDQRMDVRVRMPSARSLLVVVQNYFTGDFEEHAATLDEGARARVARISRYAWGHDYHNVIRRRLRRLRTLLLEQAGGGRVAPFNDVDAVFERAWAHAAGLGFIGKSAMFIHPKLGTWTFLGGLITDLDLCGDVAPKPLQTDLCGTCTACLDACPTQAITAPFVVDARRCLVTWNVEEATDPRGDALSAGSGWAVGCDVCQEVCPWNKFEQKTQEPRFQARHVFLDPHAPPTDIEGTALARPGQDSLVHLAQRAGPASMVRQRRQRPPSL